MAGQEQAGPEAFTVPRWHWNPRWYATGFVGSFVETAAMVCSINTGP